MAATNDTRPGSWLASVVLGAVGGVMLVSLGSLGLLFLLASIGVVLWKGPRGLAAAGLLTGIGLIWFVLFTRVALTCGGPLDPGVSECVTGDLRGWIIGGAVVFGIGLVASAIALRRTRS